MENLFKKNPLQDLLSSVNAVISTSERIEFITDHMTLTRLILKSYKRQPPRYVVELPVQILVFNRIPLEENKGLKYPFGVEKFQQKYVDYLLWLSFIYILSHSSKFQTTLSNLFF